MRQDKDRSSKWLLAHHGDAILKLGGISGFSSWKAVQPETVAPRRLPDGLIEIRFPGEAEPTLVLVEIETYPDADADRQVLDDLMLIAVDRKVVPDVVSLILKPKGNLAALGRSNRTSPRGRTRIGGSWQVIRLWELDAEALLAAGDVGLIPWVPMAKTTLPPDELMTRCRDRLATVTDKNDWEGLSSVTLILAHSAFGRNFLDLFGGPDAMIDSPFMDEMKQYMEAKFRKEWRAEGLAEGRAEGRAEGLREGLLAVLETRFGSVPPECRTALATVPDEARLRALHRLAMTCPDLEAFIAALAAEK